MIGKLQLLAVIAGLVLVIILTAGQSKTARLKLRQAVTTNKRQEKMQDAAANYSRRRSDVAGRMRNGDF